MRLGRTHAHENPEYKCQERVEAASSRLRAGQRQDAAAALTHRLIGQEPYFRNRFRSEAAQTGVDTRRAAEGPAGVLNSTSRSPAERNA